MGTAKMFPIRDPQEAPVILLYFTCYFSYLFFHPESEFHHWLTLVLIPFLLILLVRKGENRTVVSVLASVGLRKDNLHRGLGWAVVLGLILSILQIYFSRNASEILELFSSGEALFLFPIAFGLMLITAGFTEEFFFRGLLQTRLESIFQSRAIALIVSAILFGIYHLPYAYVNPNWPSHGDWRASWSAALGQGIPGGLILGAVFLLSRKNLLANVLVHSLLNSLPAMTLIRLNG